MCSHDYPLNRGWDFSCTCRGVVALWPVVGAVVQEVLWNVYMIHLWAIIPYIHHAKIVQNWLYKNNYGLHIFNSSLLDDFEK